MARKDNKGRNLKTGEYQRPDGRYEYRYKDEITGKRNSVYAADLASLREMEKKINKGNITSYDIIKPYTLYKRHYPTRLCIYNHAMQGDKFYQSEQSHHQQCQYMHRKEIPKSLKISFHFYSTLEIGCKVNNYILIKAKFLALFCL